MQALVWQFILGLERPWILPFWNPSIYVTHNWGLQLSHDTSGVTAKGTADEGGLEERGCKQPMVSSSIPQPLAVLRFAAGRIENPWLSKDVVGRRLGYPTVLIL